MAKDEEERLQRWEKATSIPLTLVALVFILAWSWPVIDPGLPEWVVRSCRWATGLTWLLVGLDYLVRLGLAGNRRRYIRANIFGLLVVLFPAMGSLQVIRLLSFWTVIRTRVSSRLRKRVATYAIGVSLLLIWFGGTAVLAVERGVEGSNITTLGDGLWWALVTTTTVGYGDHFPVTPTGRTVAGVLMICGIALMGAVTAMLTSWIVDRVNDASDDPSMLLLKEIGELRGELADLRAQLPTRSAEMVDEGRKGPR